MSMDKGLVLKSHIHRIGTFLGSEFATDANPYLQNDAFSVSELLRPLAPLEEMLTVRLRE
jgi:hypothetical protein